ncbi:lauroyl-Kdo(2)-lipid IV(A) myristoyltransferase [uncultured Ferrimonas sp.]|uniref:lauroyl-Kdo(2)-lipid IV(A) myristoyltransferase n=1 Tax=uncultured Ferrimonas sp. TaxID=432640 RepID=UPI00261CE1DE|nr:lauroyl-Kdo(2)-lipid IV(A) myristoyltransferase [uncultured Ferrimonas sp.]
MPHSAMDRCYQVQFGPQLLHPRNWPAWLAVGALALLALIPTRLRIGLAKALVPLARPLCKKPIRIACANLRHCFPDQTDAQRKQLIDELLHTFLMSSISMGGLAIHSKASLQAKINLNGIEHLNQARAEGRSIIFLVPHMFALEYAAVALTMTGLPMIGMVKHHRNQVFNWFACRQRVRFGGSLFHREAGISTIVRALKEGNSLFYLPDQDHGRDKSVFAPFFGCQKATLPVLSRIARCANAVVVPLAAGFCVDSGQVEVSLQAPLALDDLDKEQEARLLNQQMEQLISPYAAQYMWFLKVLKTRPEGEAKIY